MVVQQQVPLGRLPPHHLRRPQQGVALSLVEQVLEYLQVEDVGQVFGHDAGGQLDLQQSGAIVEGDDKESGSGGEGGGLRVELAEVLLAPLVHTL